MHAVNLLPAKNPSNQNDTIAWPGRCGNIESFPSGWEVSEVPPWWIWFLYAALLLTSGVFG